MENTRVLQEDKGRKGLRIRTTTVIHRQKRTMTRDEKLIWLYGRRVARKLKGLSEMECFNRGYIEGVITSIIVGIFICFILFIFMVQMGLL